MPIKSNRLAYYLEQIMRVNNAETQKFLPFFATFTRGGIAKSRGN